MVMRSLICGLLSVLILHQSASAALVWPVGAAGNGHYYDFIRAVGITWDEARAQAETKVHNGLRGHLATITSQAEHDFLRSSGICAPALYDSAWLGGFQGKAATPKDGWQWITGEPWLYTRWAPDKEPNDSGIPAGVEDGDEDYLALWGNGWWNDDAQNTQPERTHGYVIEYSQPIPEPSAAALVCLSAAAFIATRRRWGRHSCLP